MHGTATTNLATREAVVTSTPPTLLASDEALSTRYDCAMLDLDGVVYVGHRAVDGASDLLRTVRAAGMTLAFVTNNAARTPEAVADHLRELGVEADATDVVTSAQAAAREVAALIPPASAVLVVGGEGLEVALRERGLTPVSSVAEHPLAVVQGFHPDVGWRLLAQGAYAVTSGLPWVVSNLDLTVPTAEGLAPGNGTLVAAIEAVAGHPPDVVAGKPFRPLFDETQRRVGAQRPLVVGDRLDTDIEGANRCDAHSLLVMTGVTDVEGLCDARPDRRPSYVAWTLEGLMSGHPTPRHQSGVWLLNDWSVTVVQDRLEVTSRGSDRDDGLRAVAVAAWEWHDTRPHATLAASRRGGDHVSDDGAAGGSETTVDPRVDAAVARLDELESLDLPGQLEVFTDLQSALATVLDSPDVLESDSEPEPEPQPAGGVDDFTLRSPAS
jgi:glycerol 3-phosphatase-2